MAVPVDLSILIVTHNSRSDIIRCLTSIAGHCCSVRSEVIVADNASMDGTADEIASHCPQVVLLRLAENAGFARANNLAFARSRGRHVLLLNPDTWVDSDLCFALVNFLDTHPHAAACAPRVLLPDGQVQPGSVRALPSLALLSYEQFGLSRIFPHSRHFGAYRMSWWPHDDERPVPQPTGACLALRREVFTRVGGFDEGYFMYYEDVDLSKKLQQHGYETFYVPQANVYHAGGQSGGQAAIKNFVEEHRSMYRYFCKHHSRNAARVAKVVVTCGLLIKILALLAAMPFDRLLAPPRFWKNRREKLRGHLHLLWRHCSF